MAFFSDRKIDFRPLRWEVFAHRLREEYDASVASTAAPAASMRRLPTAKSRMPRRSFCVTQATIARRSRCWAKDSKHRASACRRTQQLRAGDNWARLLLQVIEKQVNYVVVVQTQAMTTAEQGWFPLEIETALRRDTMQGEFDGTELGS